MDITRRRTPAGVPQGGEFATQQKDESVTVLTDYRFEEPRVSITLSCDNVVQTGFGCPTVFEWKDDDENEYYFRLRNGCWRVENQTTGEVVCSGSSDEFDGVCSEQDMRDMVLSEGLYLLKDGETMPTLSSVTEVDYDTDSISFY